MCVLITRTGPDQTDKERKNRMNRRMRIRWFLGTVIAACLFLFPAEAGEYSTVEEAVTGIVATMNAAGITGEYNRAVWLHDWLITNANYDYEEEMTDPAGVLLYGAGVCQSYTDAYELLMLEAGFPASSLKKAESRLMNHTWNIVYLEGCWCHVDCTWDDPGRGGREMHYYFGMDDDLMSRNHHGWNRAAATCSGLENYYPLRNPDGSLIVYSTDDMITQLNNAASDKVRKVSFIYLGTEPGFKAQDEVSSWYDTYGAGLGITACSGSYTTYTATLTFEYPKPSGHSHTVLAEPAAAPDFSMDSPEGTFELSDYKGNGMVLIFAQPGSTNTAALLNGFAGEVEELNNNGVEVLVSVYQAEDAGDIFAMEEQHPGYKYTYDQSSLMWRYLRQAGYEENTVIFPCVFIIDSDGKIVSYSTEYVENIEEEISMAHSLETGKELPEPRKTDPEAIVNGSGNVQNLSGGEIVRAIRAAAGRGSHALFVTDKALSASYTQSMLNTWEKNYALYESLGMEMIAAYETEPSDALKAQYSHVTFVSYDGAEIHALLESTGFQGQDMYLETFFYDPNGKCLSYQNGSVLSLKNCALLVAERSHYDLVIPAGLTAIDDEAFSGSIFRNADLTGGSLTRIGALAFAGNGNLHLVRIPASVTEIDESAFDNCGNIILICPGKSEACRFAVRNGISYINR